MSLASMTQRLPSGGLGKLSSAPAVNSKKLPGRCAFFVYVRAQGCCERAIHLPLYGLADIVIALRATYGGGAGSLAGAIGAGGGATCDWTGAGRARELGNQPGRLGCFGRGSGRRRFLFVAAREQDRNAD